MMRPMILDERNFRVVVERETCLTPKHANRPDTPKFRRGDSRPVPLLRSPIGEFNPRCRRVPYRRRRARQLAQNIVSELRRRRH